MNTSQTLLGLDPKLVVDLAARMKPPHILAVEYGLDPDFLGELVETDYVKRLISQKRKELEDAGFVLQAKAKLMFEDLLPDVYRKAKSEGATLGGVLEAAKFMRTVAGLDKQDAGTQGQEKFSITINVGGAQTNQPITIDISPSSDADLPAAPAWLNPISTSSADLAYVE